MLDCFLLYRFHSESGQYKRAKTVKVNISSSYLTPVLFNECDEIDKPILIFLQKAYTGCMCTVSVWASEHYTRVTHGSCVTPPRHVSCLGHWKIGLSTSKMIPGLRSRGSQTIPKCPGTECPGWTEGVIKSPLLNGCPAVRLHSLTLCVYMCPSLAVFLSVIHKSGFINNTKAAHPFLCTYSTFTCSDATSTLWSHKNIRLSRNTSDAFI